MFALLSWKKFFWRGGHLGGDSVTWVDLKGATSAQTSPSPEVLPRSTKQGLALPSAQPIQEASFQGGSAGNGVEGPGPDNQGSDTPSVLAMIRRQVLAARHYPEAARRAGIEGTVLVGFEIGPDGGVFRLMLRRSSGSGLLDEEALATIRRAAPFPPYPGELLIPVNYALDVEE